MRILHDNGEGGVAITTPSPQYVAQVMAQNPSMTEAQVVAHIAEKDCPTGHEIVPVSAIPTNRTFREAWVHDTSPAPEKIKTDIVKAKVVAHDMRRTTREEAFAPHDKMATVPSMAVKAEAARQVIRDADAIKQTAIDAATTEQELHAALGA